MGMAMAQVAGATRTLTGESLIEPGLTELGDQRALRGGDAAPGPHDGPAPRLHVQAAPARADPPDACSAARSLRRGRPGAGGDRLLRGPRRVHAARRAACRWRSSAASPGGWDEWRRGGLAAGTAGEADRRRGDVRLARNEPAADCALLAGRGGRGRGARTSRDCAPGVATARRCRAVGIGTAGR